MTLPVVSEVKDFLLSLKGEFPELFKKEARFKGDKRDEALRIFSERVAHWSGLMGVRYNSVRIKDQRTLWGSCSVKGNLNFNWRVIHAPPEVLDYLVIHELAHLLEMNHSPRFWSHVAQWCPDHRVHRRWLRDNHRSLKARRLTSPPSRNPLEGGKGREGEETYQNRPLECFGQIFKGKSCLAQDRSQGFRIEVPGMVGNGDEQVGLSELDVAALLPHDLEP